MLNFTKSHTKEILPIIQVYRQLEPKLMTENFMVYAKFDPTSSTVEMIRLVCGAKVIIPETFGFQYFFKNEKNEKDLSYFLLKKDNVLSQEQAFVNGYMFEFVKVQVGVIKKYSDTTEFKKDALAAKTFLHRSDFELLENQIIKQVLENKFIPCNQELSSAVEPFIDFLLKQSNQNTQKKSA